MQDLTPMIKYTDHQKKKFYNWKNYNAYFIMEKQDEISMI